MKVLDDYRCDECGADEERLARIGDPVKCNVCGGNCVRVVTPGVRFTLESVSGDFPTATSRWEKDYRARTKRAVENGD